MAARGAESKQKITETILNTFENSFAYDKSSSPLAYSRSALPSTVFAPVNSTKALVAPKWSI